ncbi:hypothetical protein [Portibacter lacus]|uniref:Uncharacterized protein n=1 Tax=Portibacter lacus TaxID=1099794 RepID=A0AA37SSA8_9BACT|nr:hypothetical protein [Portibacter lacus]GLR18805.1 hypothetical protein GCM10007940_34210 [Portibacter lacus]
MRYTEEWLVDNVDLTINNFIKYAEANNVLFQFSKFDSEVQIVVEVDGRDFDY